MMEGAKKTFRERIRRTKPTRWVRFGIVAVLYTLWTVWMGNWWLLLWLLLLGDIYVTGYIPLTWWKGSKSPVVRTLMSWVDAIVYALVLVYFIFAFVGQNYTIPSSSLEKTLLVGDYLWVNKMAYGPRVPMTPIHFPLVQNTLPIVNTKSYLESPQVGYRRLKGFGSVERGDIVVFNFPAGDTVALKVQNPDYYTLCKMFGREAVQGRKEEFGEIIWRPVDRRENYVKRAVGLPGDVLSIRDGVIEINGEAQAQPEHVQFNHFFQLSTGVLSDADREALGIAQADLHTVRVTPFDTENVRASGFMVRDDGSVPTLYAAPLTEAMVKALESRPDIVKVMRVPAETGDYLFPDKGAQAGWTRADYGPVWIPKKGSVLKLDRNAWDIYERAIRVYEGNEDAELRNDSVFIGEEYAPYYRFKMDYYFMMGDNRDNSLDSRYWGFVPEDHIVGRPEVTLISIDNERGLFGGGLRTERILRWANPDKRK